MPSSCVVAYIRQAVSGEIHLVFTLTASPIHRQVVASRTLERRYQQDEVFFGEIAWLMDAVRPSLESPSERRPDRITLFGANEQDNLLIARIAAGDDYALGEVVDRFGGVLIAIARRVSGSHAVAEDVLQEVISELWRHPERYSPERGIPEGLPGCPGPAQGSGFLPERGPAQGPPRTLGPAWVANWPPGAG